jgi:hypothetical protein
VRRVRRARRGWWGVATTSALGPTTAAAPATSEPVVLEGGRHPVYYIRNLSSRLRTLPVAADAPITANPP